jgi:SnoaL-like domain
MTITVQPEKDRPMHKPPTGAVSVVEEHRLRIVRHAMEAFDRGDRTEFRLSLADDAVERDEEAGYVVRGAAAITETLWAMRELFPRIEVEINRAAAHLGEAEVEIVWCNQMSNGLVAPGEESATIDPCVQEPDRTIFEIRDRKIPVISHQSRLRYRAALSRKDQSEQRKAIPADGHSTQVTSHLPCRKMSR